VLAGGGFRAVDQGCDVSASNQITIQFIPVIGAPKIGAIEIVQQGGAVVSVAVNSSSPTVTPPQTAQFTATVTGSADTSVTWALSPGSVGSLTSTGPATALYTPPATVSASQPVTVIATSNADKMKSASATITVLPNMPPPFPAIRVNAGGPAYTDPQGQMWAADTGYSAGNTYSTGAGISNTTTPFLYQSERWSLQAFQYQFPVPSGSYHVNLKFSENYATGPGQRVFNVSVNGQCALNNVDIFVLAGGGFRAVDQGCDVSASNQITIQFIPVIGAPKIGAIEILATNNGAARPSPR
jgi:hypothetical protein